MAVAVSNLLYLRNIFPEVAFQLVGFQGSRMNILQTKSYKNDSANKVINNIFEFFGALDKGYSDEFMLEITWQNINGTDTDTDTDTGNDTVEIYHYKLLKNKDSFEFIMCT
jgi:hypothetical protein